MILQVFSIYDSKAQAFLPPFFLPKESVAIRVFSSAASDPEHAFGAFPGDYTLFHIGSFDDDNAKIETKATPRNLGLAQEHVLPTRQSPQVDLVDVIEDEIKKSNSEDLRA